MTPKIYLVFVDDWELSGNGSGDVERLQLRPMRELVDIYDRHGIKGSFNAEVMQQLTFRRYQNDHPDLRELADRWDDAICETYKRGHDVQLHVHPQWQDAKRENGEWMLSADWSILNHPPEAAWKMLSQCKDYLESVLRVVDPEYCCVSFRSGSWCIAPSQFMLDHLVKLGIVFDMSIVGGVRYDTRRINLDYTRCDETFLPYYPVMTDARKVSDKRERIVCVPTNHFYGSRRQVLRHHLGQVATMFSRSSGSTKPADDDARSVAAYGHEWAQTSHASLSKRIYEKGVVPYMRGKHLISDIAQLDYPLLGEMLASIRRRARASGLERVPVILENHTKDIHDFSDIEHFIADVATAEDIECITLTRLADDLRAGKFAIKTAAPVHDA